MGDIYIESERYIEREREREREIYIEREILRDRGRKKKRDSVNFYVQRVDK